MTASQTSVDKIGDYIDGRTCQWPKFRRLGKERVTTRLSRDRVAELGTGYRKVA